MSEWKQCKIGNVLQLEYGKSLRNYHEGQGQFDVFGTNGKIGKTDSFLYDKPSLIIGRKGAYRGVHYTDKPFFVIDTAFYSKSKTKELNTKFLYYWFKTIDINSMDSGSAIPSTSRDEVYDIDILLPSKNEQDTISNILSSLDEKIELLHRQNATLEKMAEALFRQWFVEEVEDEWEKDILSYFAEFFNGKARPKEEGSVPIYGGNGILGYTNKSNYSGKSIIIGRVGAYCGSLYFENKDIWVSDNALLVKAKRDKTTQYLYYLLKSLDLNSMAEGSSHPLLTQTLLRSIEIQKPPINKILEFESLVDALQQKINSNKSKIHTLTTLRDTLLPKLMNGEVKMKMN